jgi:alpha-L-rhamnosidase
VRIRVSADERYELFLDGNRVGRGSERGNLEHWFYEIYDLALAAGDHVLVARVWSFGPYAPLAQFSVRPEFLLAAEGKVAGLLDTGVAVWEAKKLPGYAIDPPVYVWGLTAPETVEGASFAWDFELGHGEGWRRAEVGTPAWSGLKDYGIAPDRLLQNGTLPPQFECTWNRGTVRLAASVDTLETTPIAVRAADHLPAESEAWQHLLRGQASLTLPPRTRRRVIVDLDDYVCAYPELVVSGGAGSLVRILWAESLREKLGKWEFDKGNRDAVEGKYFLGMGATFRPDGGRSRRFGTLWWSAGRYLEITVQTAADPLVLDSFVLSETRYPLEMESAFSSSDPELDADTPLLVRGEQMCAHETYVDCPYFEQMQYLGDARIEARTQYIMSRDDRLSRKALYMIAASRHASGLTEARYPVREPQFIPWFSLLVGRHGARLRPLAR